MLATHELVNTRELCQLMKPPDPSLGNLQPIQPAPALTRWGIDHTQTGQYYSLNTTEYAMG